MKTKVEKLIDKWYKHADYYYTKSDEEKDMQKKLTYFAIANNIIKNIDELNDAIK